MKTTRSLIGESVGERLPNPLSLLATTLLSAGITLALFSIALTL